MICALMQWFISESLNRRRQAPLFVRRHAGRCRECGFFLNAGVAFGERLESDSSEVGPPAGLARPDVELWDEDAGRRLGVLALAACLAVTLALAAMFKTALTGHGDLETVTNESASIALGSVDPVLNAMSDDALAGELENLADDAESAVRFVLDSSSLL